MPGSHGPTTRRSHTHTLTLTHSSAIHPSITDSPAHFFCFHVFRSRKRFFFHVLTRKKHHFSIAPPPPARPPLSTRPSPGVDACEHPRLPDPPRMARARRQCDRACLGHFLLIIRCELYTVSTRGPRSSRHLSRPLAHDPKIGESLFLSFCLSLPKCRTPHVCHMSKV